MAAECKFIFYGQLILSFLSRVSDCLKLQRAFFFFFFLEQKAICIADVNTNL